MNTFVQADIREEGDKVRFRVTHAAPVPTVPFEVLTRPGNSLHSNYFECVEGWTKTVDESGITLERLDEGPWALGMAVRECIQLLRALGNSDPDDPPNEQSEQG